MSLITHPLALKIAFLLIAFGAHGRPFMGFTDYAFALLVAYFLLFGQVRQHIKPLMIGAGIAFLILARFVPQLHIPEEQRLLIDRNNVITTPEQYIQNPANYPFFLTADGYVQGYHDKRIVNGIDIDQNVLSLRSGVINRPEFNFYTQGYYERTFMPYVVCYTITPAMVGMTLSLDGRLFFERNGNFVPHDPSQKLLTITASQVGQKLYGFGGLLDGKDVYTLRISLEKTQEYKLYDASRIISMFMGLILLFSGLFVILPTREFALQSALLGFSALSFWFFNPNICRWGILSKGGMDGIIHDGYPYWMLEKLALGDWVAALRSPEWVFYFMPGMRYVRFIEMLLFGDAYILQVCLIIFVPLIFYRFFSAFLIKGVSITLVSIMFFHLLNEIGLSFKLYTKSLLDLYGEGLAFALLFISLTLLVKSIRNVGWGIVAFSLLSITLAIRPNLAIFVGVLCAIHLFSKTFSPSSWKFRFCMLLGLAPCILIPIHNILGGEFVLLTKAAQIPENLPLSPGHYYQTICHLIGIADACDHSSRLAAHFAMLRPQYIAAWFGCLYVAFKGQSPVIRSLALACFGGLSVHIFYLPDIRYMHPYLTIAIVLGLYQIKKFRALSSNTSLM
jgi:hypothetical protein